MLSDIHHTRMGTPEIRLCGDRLACHKFVPSCHVCTESSVLLVNTPNLSHLVSGLEVRYPRTPGTEILGPSMAGTFHGLPGTVHGSPGTDLKKYICLDCSLFVCLFVLFVLFISFCLFVCLFVCLFFLLFGKYDLVRLYSEI